jgi:hypothetical protein
VDLVGLVQEALVTRNPGLRIASHVHCAAQVTRGVALGKPILVLLREPRSALAAFRVAYPNLSVGVLAYSYRQFYRTVVRRPGPGQDQPPAAAGESGGPSRPPPRVSGRAAMRYFSASSKRW